MAHDLGALAAVPLFSHLEPDRLRRTADRSIVRTVNAGEVVAGAGHAADHLLVLVSGALTATHDTANGQRLRLSHVDGPCAVDKAAVLDRRGYSATWTVTSRARVVLVPAAEFRTLLDEVPAARGHVFAHLAAQLRRRQDDLVRAHFSDAATRTAGWLIRAAAGGRPRVLLPGAQHGLAETLGLSRVTVNRALRTLARDGVIRIEPGAVVVLDPARLARRAHG